MSDNNWRMEAACREVDPEAFYPSEYDPFGVEAAFAVCRTCPVAVQCLEDAMETEANDKTKYRYGIRGGLTGAQRRRLAREVASA